MNPVLFIIPTVLLVASIILAVVLVKKGIAVKKVMRMQFATLGVIVVLSCLLTVGVSAAEAKSDASAQTSQSESADQASGGVSEGLKYIGAALAVGLAGIGGGIAVASGAPAAIGATAEDPKSFGKSIIFVALGEGFGLYGLLIAIMILIL